MQNTGNTAQEIIVDYLSNLGLPVHLLLNDSQNKTASEKAQKLRRSAKVKGQILCDLPLWYGLIEDNDPRNPLQHKINSNRPTHSPLRLSEFRLHLVQATDTRPDDSVKGKAEECCRDTHITKAKEIRWSVPTMFCVCINVSVIMQMLLRSILEL